MYFGIDFIVFRGMLIQVIGKGCIVKVGRGFGYGFCVVIDYGYGYKILYVYMDCIDVKVGDEVNRG